MELLLVDVPYSCLKGFVTNRGYIIGLTSLAAYTSREGVETGIIAGDLIDDQPSTQATDWWQMSARDLATRQGMYVASLENDALPLWTKFKDILIQTQPKIVGIQYLTPMKLTVQKLGRLIKEVNPDIKVVVGGFHPTFCPEEVLQDQDIDFVIRGEGEIPLLALVKELRKDQLKLETIPGLSYRDTNGQIRSNPCPDLIADLDMLPFPSRHLVLNCDYSKYRVHNLATVRGCPYTCSFCADHNFWCGRVRRRSVENVMEELTLLKHNYKIDYVEFTDGTFTYDKNYLYELCNLMIEHKLGIEWRCTARYDNITEEMLKLMKRANCSALYFGFESGSDRLLKIMNKRMNIEQILEVNKMVRASGITTANSVILGLPDESREDIKETLRMMRLIKTDFFDINTYMPLPGAPIYETVSDEAKRNINWGKISIKSVNNFFSKTMQYDEYSAYLSEAFKIGDSVRKRSLLRLGARMLPGLVAKKFTGLLRKPGRKTVAAGEDETPVVANGRAD